MTEIRCKSCNKVLAYIKEGSMIAEGVKMYCAPCHESIIRRPSNDVPDFLRGLMKGKR